MTAVFFKQTETCEKRSELPRVLQVVAVSTADIVGVGKEHRAGRRHLRDVVRNIDVLRQAVGALSELQRVRGLVLEQDAPFVVRHLGRRNAARQLLVRPSNVRKPANCSKIGAKTFNTTTAQFTDLQRTQMNDRCRS